MVSNMQGLMALVRSTFSKAFWYRVGDLSRISCSQWMHGRAIHLAASYYDAMDEYGRPKKVNRIEEVCIGW